MIISREGTLALNDYLDRVTLSLPLSPSRRAAVVDRLYHQICATCEQRARETNRLEIGFDLIQAQLAALGPAEQQAEQLATDERNWSTESLGFGSEGINEKASAFAKVAAERGEYVFRVSVETAANALDLAAQKLREAAEKMKSKG